MAEAPIVDQPKPEAMNMTQGSARDAVDALASGDTSNAFPASGCLTAPPKLTQLK